MFASPSYQSWPRVSFVQHTRRSWPLRGLAVVADSGGEPPSPGLGLAGRDRGNAQPEFVQGRLVPIEGPLLDGRAPVIGQGCLRRASSCARRSDSASAWPGSTRRLASPIRSASSPDTPRPVRIMSIARGGYWLVHRRQEAGNPALPSSAGCAASCRRTVERDSSQGGAVSFVARSGRRMLQG